MRCEACGGDGLIEVGAYRGDESSETRECRLCGGTATAPPVLSLGQFGVSAERAAQALDKLSQTGLTLKESTSSVRRTVGVLVTDDAQDWAKRHAAEWDGKLRREKCGNTHAWQLVRYLGAGRLVKCSHCGKMKYRKS